MQLSHITQPFLERFPGDTSGNTQQRQTPGVLYCTVKPDDFEQVTLLAFNQKLAERIGLGSLAEDTPFLAAQQLPPNVTPYATAYAGHQFGRWAGQLGDGRAIFAGEICMGDGVCTELQWKGAGATPYSRFADGRAVLRSSLREYLMSEAMYHLGVPTTRALSLCLTGESVVRDLLYRGDPRPEPGAVVMRTAPTFLRFGHFELLAAQNDVETLRQLADHTIQRYFPEITETGPGKYLQFYRSVADRTARLMTEWLRVGFVHGVMNTDNMSIIGQTIDYGPFAMLEEYDLNFTSNTTDLPGRRYAFGKQPQIGQWNLWQLGNALHLLISDTQALEQVLDDYNLHFWQYHDEMMAQKFGFGNFLPGDDAFFIRAQKLMSDHGYDYTKFFVSLELMVHSDQPNVDLFCEEVSYMPVTEQMKAETTHFLQDYLQMLSARQRSAADAVACMRRVNPKFILRNYLLYQCIQEVEAGDYRMLQRLQDALERPYETPSETSWIQKRPVEFSNIPGCTALSCSS